LQDAAVTEAIAAAEARLGQRGRVLIRASGTEPVIRVMAEAEEEALVEDTVMGLSALIRARAAAGPLPRPPAVPAPAADPVEVQ
ncbi:phosphoglucosamine mutase, partial [Roseomonas vastitatis]|nr:phosphoglucosamine mutase [Pseudoroseomonas vastitatis]